MENYDYEIEKRAHPENFGRECNCEVFPCICEEQELLKVEDEVEFIDIEEVFYGIGGRRFGKRQY